MPAYITIPRIFPANIGNVQYSRFKKKNKKCKEMHLRNVMFQSLNNRVPVFFPFEKGPHCRASLQCEYLVRYLGKKQCGPGTDVRLSSTLRCGFTVIMQCDDEQEAPGVTPNAFIHI